jgi:hypothetical protein
MFQHYIFKPVHKGCDNASLLHKSIDILNCFTKKGQQQKKKYDEQNARICSQVLWLVKQLSMSIDLCRRDALSQPLCTGLNM